MRGTLDINRESNIHAAAGTMQTPISIHALHEESDLSCLHLHGRGLIPIHALHEESDKTVGNILSQLRKISIHALHEESDRIRC